MSEQLLKLTPASELKFIGPFNVGVNAPLNLENVSDKTVAYKVKTTAPKDYCVRPTSGYLQPGQNIDIEITLQSFDYDPKNKPRHKFMVQSIEKPASADNVETFWKNLTTPTCDQKMKCSFVDPSSALPSVDEVSSSMHETDKTGNSFAHDATPLEPEITDTKPSLRQRNVQEKPSYSSISKPELEPMMPRHEMVTKTPAGQFTFKMVLAFVLFAFIVGFLLGKAF